MKAKIVINQRKHNLTKYNIQVCKMGWQAYMTPLYVVWFTFPLS